MDKRPPHRIVPFDEIPLAELEHFVQLTTKQAAHLKDKPYNYRCKWLGEQRAAGILQPQHEPVSSLAIQARQAEEGLHERRDQGLDQERDVAAESRKLRRNHGGRNKRYDSQPQFANHPKGNFRRRT